MVWHSRRIGQLFNQEVSDFLNKYRVYVKFVILSLIWLILLKYEPGIILRTRDKVVSRDMRLAFLDLQSHEM